MTPEQKLELFENLFDEFITIIQEVISSGEVLSDELQGLLADELEYMFSEIEELRKEVGERGTSEIDQATINSIPSLDSGPFPSSNVNSFKYNPENGDLFVKFHGKESADSGPIYKYDGIPKPIYDSFSKGSIPPKTSGKNRYHEWVKGVTPSLGASLYSLIKNGGYPYQRIS